ncbi:MAG: protein-tyrosine-phosphatase [Flavobacteriales bacterium]|nr:protein-tyrosine-phosphatase [Flavobacteriales bacterium]
MFPEIESYVTDCAGNFSTIGKERQKQLEAVAAHITDELNSKKTVNLVFICTHNSRRSQFGQVWAAVAAAHYGVRNVQTFSGGTEETAFNKRAVEAIQRAGLKVSGTVGTNPRYSIRFSDEVGALDCYSKTFDASANPQKGFIAIMTCSDADEACPIVPGADFRARITYEDPKVADRTAQEREVYDERCKQIATEMLYLFSKVA